MFTFDVLCDISYAYTIIQVKIHASSRGYKLDVVADVIGSNSLLHASRLAIKNASFVQNIQFVDHKPVYYILPL